MPDLLRLRRLDTRETLDLPTSRVGYYLPLRSGAAVRSALLRSEPRTGDVPYLREPGQRWAPRVEILPRLVGGGGRLRAAFERLLKQEPAEVSRGNS